MDQEKRISLIRKQLEYYLSNKNLERDQFFFEMLKQNKEGYLDLTTFLNCNNIKKQETTIEDLIEAIKQSEKLELNSEENQVRRKNNEALPVFLGKKTEKDKDEEKKTKHLEHPDEKIRINHMLEYSDPIIIFLSSDKDQVLKWKDLSKKLNEIYPDYEVVYIRFGYQKGQAAVFSKFKEIEGDSKENNDLKLKEEKPYSKAKPITEHKFQIEGINVESRLATEEELNEFWRDHGSHYEFCISQRLNVVAKKTNQPRMNRNILKAPVTLGGEIYNELGKIKSRARGIFYSVTSKEMADHDFEITNKSDKSFLVDLFKYVDKDVEMDNKITIGRLSLNTYGKSFFVTKKDKIEKESISYIQAVTKIGICIRKGQI